MTKMIFPKEIKYKGVSYPPNTVVEVNNNDVKNFKDGWVLGEKPKEEKAKKEANK